MPKYKMQGLTYMPSKMLEQAIWCMFFGISMQSQIPMKMTQCLKNEYGEGCSLDRKQKTSKKEKLSKEKWFISLFRSQRFCEKIFWLPGVSNGNMMINADQREYDIMFYKNLNNIPLHYFYIRPITYVPTGIFYHLILDIFLRATFHF